MIICIMLRNVAMRSALRAHVGYASVRQSPNDMRQRAGPPVNLDERSLPCEFIKEQELSVSKMAGSYAAALLDELMGRNRDANPDDKRRDVHWSDVEVCVISSSRCY